MKKTTQTLMMLVIGLLLNLQVFSQQSVDSELDGMITATQQIETSANRAKTALKTLVIMYFVDGTTTANTQAFLTQVSHELITINGLSGVVLNHVFNAESINNNIDTNTTEDLIQEVQGARFQANTNAIALVKAIENNNANVAYQLNRSLRSNFNTILNYSKQLQTEIESLKAAPKVYNIRIELVDYRTGAPVTSDAIDGYGATNVTTNRNYYSEYRQGEPRDVILGVPEGTYRFDGRDGYFDGTTSTTLTLSDSLVEPDGFIVVTLSYWYE
ncbi:hypothetical protein SAMN04489761_0785 [Tenacibaculum sp. MAR_2009_124]|uniref:hypothetical protein n=1 Tax=Tenacibaculum sp. MAR_2009_124 TaxID=1250059 RepID=UPI00089970C9|nr:hypothetical protein [Tenacibaculum sp. MAR_2009_124]SEB44928.1 hypothetical protein SAMN04489761_0785 [Tenacibaculum sp. MAR_2009_124]